MMRFEWDESKRMINIRKHGIDFEEAYEIFNNPMLRQTDRQTFQLWRRALYRFGPDTKMCRADRLHRAD